MLLQKPVQGFTAKHALADALFFSGASLAPGTQLRAAAFVPWAPVWCTEVRRSCAGFLWRRQQVPVWCTESQPCGALSVPNLGSAHVLQVLCNPAGKLAYQGHL